MADIEEHAGAKPAKKIFTKRSVTDFVAMNIGALLLAAGTYFFKSTNHFVTGGIGGLALVISNFTEPHVAFLNQSTLVLIMNVLLLIVGFIFLGKGCTGKTVYCTLAFSLENSLFEWLVSLDGPVTDQPVLELLYAVLLTGIGSALIFNSGSSSGGTDIIAMIMRKHTSLNVGQALFVVDMLIAVSSFFVYGVECGLFSVMGLFANVFIIDLVIENMGKTKFITIISSRPKDIENYIIKDIRHAYTTYPATGGYTGENRTVIITVCRKREAYRLKKMVNESDPDAFVIISDANEIVGRGFRPAV